MENLNAEQVIKAMECCYDNNLSCIDCPFQASDKYVECAGLTLSALSLIKELTEENERLRAEAENQSILWKQHFESIYETAKETVRADTVRKMQERLKAEVHENVMGRKFIMLYVEDIDQIAKELEGENV